MNAFSMSTFDTTPGATGEFAVLAPPANVVTHDDYLAWLREARNDPGLNQVMACSARAVCGRSMFFRPPEIIGPLAATLEHALKGMAKWMYTPPGNKAPRQSRSASSAVDLSPGQLSEAPLDLFESQALL